MELEAQRNRTAETHKEIQAKERGLDEDSLNLERKIREVRERGRDGGVIECKISMS